MNTILKKTGLAKGATLLLLLFVTLQTGFAQSKPAFWDDIQQFKKQDSLHFPGTGKILFVGSSSFTKWTDVQNYFPDYPIINRGFGGSTLLDVTRYMEDIIFPYKPKQVVMYCGENDLAYSDTVTAEMVFKRFTTLYYFIRRKTEDVPFVFISIKPSPSRWQLKDKMIQANELIKTFLNAQKQTKFIDVFNPMLGADGKPLPDIFLEDKLHMNAKGYAIWQKLIEPWLKK
jgi:lysophospholipase L1-like esterase